MAYQLYGWVLRNGERHVLKADAIHHPGFAGELIKAEGDLQEECCCPLCCCEFEDCVVGGTVTPPATLTATLTTTGDCSCMPSSITLTYDGPGTCSWSGSAMSTCLDPDELVSIVLGCTGA